MSAQHSDHGPRPASAEALRLGYEPPYVSMRPMVIGLIVAVVVAALIFAASWFIEVVMLRVDKGKTATASAVQPSPVVSSRPLPPLQPSTLHRATDREDVHAMHIVEDRVFADMGWAREREPRTDPDKATAVVPFRVPDNVLAAVANRTAGIASTSRPITKETPEPAPTAPATTTGAPDATTPPPATTSAAVAPATNPAATTPTTGGAQ